MRDSHRRQPLGAQLARLFRIACPLILTPHLSSPLPGLQTRGRSSVPRRPLKAARPAAAAPPPPPLVYKHVSTAEQAQLTSEQCAFLERKRGGI